MIINYVFIDYENVQPESMDLLDKENFRVILFVGASQTKIAIDTAMVLHRMGERALYIKVPSNGSNVLDFHICYYVGKISAQDPTAYSHIISKDTGFDPLIKHLKSKKVHVSRWPDISEIPMVKATEARTIEEKLEIILSYFRRTGVTKPRTVKTLSNNINALFHKTLSEKEILELMNGLEKQGVITVEGTQVSYKIPAV